MAHDTETVWVTAWVTQYVCGIAMLQCSGTHHAEVIAVLKGTQQSDDMLAVVCVTVSQLAEYVQLELARLVHCVVRANHFDGYKGVAAVRVLPQLVARRHDTGEHALATGLDHLISATLPAFVPTLVHFMTQSHLLCVGIICRVWCQVGMEAQLQHLTQLTSTEQNTLINNM